MARLLILLPILVLSVYACTAVRETKDNVVGAMETAVNPEVREIKYLREGNTVHYYRRDCAGDYCEKPKETLRAVGE